MSNLQKIVILCVVGGVIVVGSFFLLNTYTYEEKQTDENESQGSGIVISTETEQVAPKVLSATVTSGGWAVTFENEDGNRQEYTLADWREDVRNKFGTIRIPVGYPERFVDIDPNHITQIVFVSLSPDGTKAFLILKVAVPTQPLGRGGISALAVEVLDMQNGIAPIADRGGFDIYVTAVQSSWSPDNKYIAIAMNDTTSRSTPRENLYLCQTQILRCWSVPNSTFVVNLGVATRVSSLDFRNFSWNTDQNNVMFSTNTGNAPPPLGEALWKLNLENQQVELTRIVAESRDLQEQRAKRSAAQIAGIQSVYAWFRCGERTDYQECNDTTRTFFENREPLPFGLTVSDQEVVNFFHEKFVRFSGQSFSVVFRGYIPGYVDGETIIVLYINDASEVPRIGTIFITQNDAGQWFISKAVESLVPGLLQDIEQLLENWKNVVSEQQ